MTHVCVYVLRVRVQLEKVRAEIVYRDGGGDYRRGCPEVRPADGLDRGTANRSADVSLAAIVLRENTIATPVKNENVQRGVLPHVSKRQTDTGRRLQASGAVVAHRVGWNAGDRLVHAIGGSRCNYLRQVHTLVHNAIIRIMRISVRVFRVP